MDEYVMKQSIQNAFFEPRAPEGLIEKVVLRVQAVTMGTLAQKQMENMSTQNIGELASQVLIGQLASVSELPKDAKPEQLARQLEREPAFRAALQGGNVAHRLHNGELLQQITGRKHQ